MTDKYLKDPENSAAPQKEGVIFLAGLALPMFLILWWLLDHQFYPRNDIAEYWSIPAFLYKNLGNMSFSEQLSTLYYHRLHKAIIHPTIGYIFYWFGGNVFKSTLLFSVFFFSVFYTYLFLIGREFLKGIYLFLWLVYLGTIPWILLNTHGFTTELPILTFGLAAFYHAYRSNYLTSYKHSLLLSFFVTLSFCYRPILAFSLYTASALVFFILSFKKKSFSVRDLLISGVFAIAGIIYLSVPILKFKDPSLENLPQPVPGSYFPFIMGYLASIALVVIFRKKLKISTPLFATVALISGTLVFWYAPYSAWVYGWAHYSSYSDFLAYGSQRSGVHGTGAVSPIEFIGRLYAALGSLPLLGLLVVALFSKPWIHAKKFKAALYLFVPLVFVLQFIGAFSFSDDQRYYVLNFLVLYMLFAYFAVTPNFSFLKIRLGLFSVLLSIQIFVNFNTVFGNSLLVTPIYDLFLTRPSPLIIPLTTAKKIDPMENIFKNIQSLVPNNPETEIGIIIRRYRYENGNMRMKFYYEMFGANEMTLLMQDYDVEYGLEFFNVTQEPSFQKNIQKMKKRYSHILIGPAKPDREYDSPQESKFINRVLSQKSRFEPHRFTIKDFLDEDANYYLIPTSKL